MLITRAISRSSARAFVIAIATGIVLLLGSCYKAEEHPSPYYGIAAKTYKIEIISVEIKSLDFANLFYSYNDGSTGPDIYLLIEDIHSNEHNNYYQVKNNLTASQLPHKFTFTTPLPIASAVEVRDDKLGKTFGEASYDLFEYSARILLADYDGGQPYSNNMFSRDDLIDFYSEKFIFTPGTHTVLMPTPSGDAVIEYKITPL